MYIIIYIRYFMKIIKKINIYFLKLVNKYYICKIVYFIEGKLIFVFICIRYVEFFVLYFFYFDIFIIKNLLIELFFNRLMY